MEEIICKISENYKAASPAQKEKILLYLQNLLGLSRGDAELLMNQ